MACFMNLLLWSIFIYRATLFTLLFQKISQHKVFTLLFHINLSASLGKRRAFTRNYWYRHSVCTSAYLAPCWPSALKDIKRYLYRLMILRSSPSDIDKGVDPGGDGWDTSPPPPNFFIRRHEYLLAPPPFFHMFNEI